MVRLPPPPPKLASIQKFLKTADLFEKRNPVVAYYCRLNAAQLGVSQYGKDREVMPFLIALMDVVEQEKRSLQGNEALGNDVAAQGVVWEVANKLFTMADTNDRAGKCDKNTAQSFYTGAVLYDVLRQFGPLDDDTAQKCKYAKWKSAYILKCIKDGIEPVPGPMENGDLDSALSAMDMGEGEGAPFQAQAYNPAPAAQHPPQAHGGVSGFTPPGVYGGHSAVGDFDPFHVSAPANPQAPPHSAHPSLPQPPSSLTPHLPPPPAPSSASSHPAPSASSYPAPNPSPAPSYPPPSAASSSYPSSSSSSASSTGGKGHSGPVPVPRCLLSGSVVPRDDLSIKDSDQVTKFCKYAISALQYRDTPTAVKNLLDALEILAKK